ncbi:hypothetical protein CGMCC3_g1008 [Colletotrichum fructicola]|nr:uncharacterized protein CGMCC3_g1008 [Colletotrichum fructicola]KAE9583246.1 hypothetical protein CGMCC3_g1008 [Colletotrichum fructicola]
MILLNRVQQSKEESPTTTPFGKIPTGCKDQEQRRDRGFARIRNLPGVRFPPFNPSATSFRTDDSLPASKLRHAQNRSHQEAFERGSACGVQNPEFL